MEERKALRALMKSGESFLAPGAFNPLSALIAQSAGAKALHMCGHTVGCQLALSEPLTTMTEFVAQVASVTKVVKIPLIADAASGFGDAVNLVRCVKEFEYAGASAIHIEDQVTPKRVSYHRGYEHVIPLEDYLVKLRVALESRTDPDFVIIARTDAHAKSQRSIGSLQEAVRRCRASVKAGADAICVPGIEMVPGELKIFREQVPNVPLLTTVSLEEARQPGMGTLMLTTRTGATWVMVKALQDYYQNIMKTGDARMTSLPPETQQMRSRVMELIGLPKYWKIEEASTEKSTEKTQLLDTDNTIYRPL